MRTIKLKRLRLTNFKGIRNLVVEFSDNTTISGCNASGKTTIFDGWCFLLFGKDSEDRTNFNIKTLDKNNKAIPKIDHEVEGELVVNGNLIVLRRCYREKWVTRRGDPEPEMAGHETVYFWNEVPMQSGDYDRKIAEIFGEGANSFKLLTNPLYFNLMKWQDRRNILVNIAGQIETPERFTAMLHSMGDKSLEEYRKELAAKKKKLRAELDLIPARIDEVGRSLPETKDWDAIRKEIADLTEKIKEVDDQMLDASKAVENIIKASNDKISRIGQLKKQISDIEYDTHLKFQQGMKNRDYEIINLKLDIESIENKIKDRSNVISSLDLAILVSQEKQAKLRAEWIAENKAELVFDPDSFVCPTCRRELESSDKEEKRQEMVNNFNLAKKEKLILISAKGKKIGEEIKEIQEKIAEIKSVDLSAMLDAKRKLLEAAEGRKLEKVPFPESYHDAVKELAELEGQKIEVVQVDNTHLKLRRSGYQDRIEILKAELATRDQIMTGKARLNELSEQETSFAQQLADLEKIEFQIQEYTKSKVDALEGRINAMFTHVKFRLFDTQINGGMVECCDTLIDGVPWSDANNAAKINSGIEIINVLSQQYGVQAPIWVDNAEAVNQIADTKTQVIALYVTEDKKLKIKQNGL